VQTRFQIFKQQTTQNPMQQLERKQSPALQPPPQPNR
jgi:hypothetical protein